jgi:hypothetical protein
LILLALQQLGYNGCQFLPQGGSMGQRYYLEHLFNEKTTNLLLTQQPLALQEKISTDLESFKAALVTVA